MTTWHAHEVLKLQEQAKAEGRAEERAAIVAYMRREAEHFAIAGEGLASPGRKFMEVVGGAIEGLAGFFEDGGHLK